MSTLWIRTLRARGAARPAMMVPLVAAGALALGHPASAQTRYTLTDLGLLPNAERSLGFGINNAGQVVGYSDNTPFRWSSAAGIAALPTLPPQGSGLHQAYAINASGQVAGVSDTVGGGFTLRRAVVWSSAGVIRALPLAPGSTYAFAYAINDSGQAVGSSSGRSTRTTAVLWSGASARVLGTLPGGSTSFALGINNAGTVVGQSDSEASNTQGTTAFTWSASGGMKPLAQPAGSYGSSAHAISNRGQIAGFILNPSGKRAALWTNGTPTILGALGRDVNAEALAVNNLGVVVGKSGDSSDRAVIWTASGGLRDLNSLLSANPERWILRDATSINDKGQITGSGYLRGYLRAYLLSPVGLNAAPRNVSLAPASAVDTVGALRQFTSTYTDPNGLADLKSVTLRIGLGPSATSNAKTLLCSYDPATNRLSLLNDAGTAVVGSAIPGASTVLQNAQGSLDCRRTRVGRTSAGLTVIWTVSAKAAFVGARPVLLGSTDKAGLADGPERFGTWTIRASSTPGA